MSSDLFRKSVLNRLPAMPPTRAPWAEGDEDEDTMEELAEEEEGLSDISALPSQGSTRSSKASMFASSDLSPISPATYFAQALQVNPEGYPCTFRVYYTPSTLSATSQTSDGGKKASLLVCHHGAGSSGTTFSALAKEVQEKSKGELGVLAFDARGHGKTTTEDGTKELELSFDNLQRDFLAMICQTFPDPTESPDLVLLGHSMGASPIISSAPILQKRGYKVVGVIVLDVVEGTAVEALPLMRSILSQRPTKFRSIEGAIDWHLTSGAVRNKESARVSVPSLVVPKPGRADGSLDVIWRTDLMATSSFWEEWYLHLSSHFLAARSGKLLVLAGQERLDKELMIGQMQGKFQLEVLPDVGHYLHEDKPERLAGVLVAFWKKNTSVLVLPPKVGSAGYVQKLKMVGDP